MCHVCQEQTVSVYQIKHVINQEKLRNSDTHGHMGHGISKAFPMAERGFTVYHTTPFSFRFALADTLPDGARTTIPAITASQNSVFRIGVVHENGGTNKTVRI